MSLLDTEYNNPILFIYFMYLNNFVPVLDEEFKLGIVEAL